jgi:5-methylthioadenosine/S-adenosylhomocysteine deaminase
MGKTLVKASHIIAFDRIKHRYLLNGHLVCDGDTIVCVGRDCEGRVGKVIGALDEGSGAA